MTLYTDCDIESQLSLSKVNVNLTRFRRKVYALIKQIPKGHFSTYGTVAKALGSSARAVGGALRNNPFAPVVPCHRILCSDGGIGGFHGTTDPNSAAIKRKIALLTQEGLTFTGNILTQHDRLYRVVTWDNQNISFQEHELSTSNLIEDVQVDAEVKWS